MSILVETFPALSIGGHVQNAFIERVAGLDVATDREDALMRLAAFHDQARRDLGFAGMTFVTAEQVHGNKVAMVDASARTPVTGADALITNRPNVCLGIYVADCCAVYAVDTEHNAIGLAHSGRKGTESGVVPAMLRRMEKAYGTQIGKVVIQLSPCIRPPHYEVDFAAEIVEQCENMGVGKVIDCGLCTGSDLERYYSHRMERGQTGRMLALLALYGASSR